MKHLRRYNESKKMVPLEDKEPIDPTSDVEDFKEMFARKSEENLIKSILDNIVNNNPTMTDDWKIYGVFESNDNGEKEGDYIFYVKAVSKAHARVKAATYRKESIFITTGYYGADELSDVDGILDNLQYQIHLLKNPL
jgi:hypothetical protein